MFRFLTSPCLGNCVRSKSITMSTTAIMVIHADGRMDEYEGLVMAGQVAAGCPGFYVCSWEAMEVGVEAPSMDETEELQPGHLYFLLPLAKSRRILSLEDLCRLAAAASTALQRRPRGRCSKGGNLVGLLGSTKIEL